MIIQCAYNFEIIWCINLFLPTPKKNMLNSSIKVPVKVTAFGNQGLACASKMPQRRVLLRCDYWPSVDTRVSYEAPREESGVTTKGRTGASAAERNRGLWQHPQSGGGGEAWSHCNLQSDFLLMGGLRTDSYCFLCLQQPQEMWTPMPQPILHWILKAQSQPCIHVNRNPVVAQLEASERTPCRSHKQHERSERRTLSISMVQDDITGCRMPCYLKHAYLWDFSLNVFR